MAEFYTLVSGALARSLRSDPDVLLGALHPDLCLDVHHLPFCLLFLLWLLEQSEAEIKPFSGLAAFLLLLPLLLLDEVQTLVPVACLAPATASGYLPPWLAAAAAALEAHGDWLHASIPRRWHGLLATECWSTDWIND